MPKGRATRAILATAIVLTVCVAGAIDARSRGVGTALASQDLGPVDREVNGQDSVEKFVDLTSSRGG